MPAITVSSVSTGSDTLTATAHGLTTGDRFRLRNVGGALPTGTGIAAVTDLFAVRVDANTIKVATSSSNALAGTPIVVDITAAGSGTTTIEYGLPYCIPTALAAVGTQIKSANDNGAWNALVAIYDALTSQSQGVFSAATLASAFASHPDRTDAILGTDFKPSTLTNVTYQNTGRVITGAAVTLYARLPLKTGDRLKSVTALLGGDGSVDVTTFDVRLATAAGTSSSIGSTTVNNLTTNDTTIDVTDTTLGAGESIVVTITFNATLGALDNLRYTYDHP